MKYGDHGLSDPVQQTLEAQPFEAERHGWASAIRQQRGVDPHPQISQDQGYGHKHQPQVRAFDAGVNPRLPHLAVARFDAKPLAVALADFGRRTMHAPGTEQELLLDTFSVFAVAVGAIGHAYRDRYGALAVL